MASDWVWIQTRRDLYEQSGAFKVSNITIDGYQKVTLGSALFSFVMRPFAHVSGDVAGTM